MAVLMFSPNTEQTSMIAAYFIGIGALYLAGNEQPATNKRDYYCHADKNSAWQNLCSKYHYSDTHWRCGFSRAW